jgi:hypothetical protein
MKIIQPDGFIAFSDVTKTFQSGSQSYAAIRDVTLSTRRYHHAASAIRMRQVHAAQPDGGAHRAKPRWRHIRRRNGRRVE